MFFVYVLCVLLTHFVYTEQTLIPAIVNTAAAVTNAQVHGAIDRARVHETVARAKVNQNLQRIHNHEALELARIRAASGHLKGIRAIQPHPHLLPHHTAVLPHFAVNYARMADPDPHLHHHLKGLHHHLGHHHHHHHHHHPVGHDIGGHHQLGGHGMGGSHIGDHSPHPNTHNPTNIAIATSIVNNIRARQAQEAMRQHFRLKRDLENHEMEKREDDSEKLDLNLDLQNVNNLEKRIEKRNSHKRVLKDDDLLKVDDKKHDMQKRELQENDRGLQKRDLPQIAAARIAVDPLVKLNVIGTVDNLKDATKDLCENDNSPFYHVREAVGSARDAFFSLLKIAPNGLLIPTSYTIAEIEEIPQETVGAINKEALNAINKGQATAVNPVLPVFNDEPEPKNTLSTLQMMMRNGVRSARDHATHVGDTIHSVRRAVLAIPRSTLKLLLPYLRSLELERERKIPKGLLGTSLKSPSPNEVTKIVGAGRLLELLRKAASKDNSMEVVAQAPQCPYNRQNFKESYKQFLTKIREGIKDKLNNVQ